MECKGTLIMACKFNVSAVALEWWRASGERTVARLAMLVDERLYVNAITDQSTCDAIHQDALDNRYPWEVN